MRYNLLMERIIRVRPAAQSEAARCSLPETLSLLLADEVLSFPALRAHQRFPWHAFLVQIAALALHRAGLEEPPREPERWRELLRGLTPAFPEGEPWCLVAPPDRPALLQAPAPGGRLDGFKPVPTPDALDMLVTSRNHDLKREAMVGAEPDDWLMALVSLQTQEGVMGAGKYGIARMNGGYGSRPCFSIRPPGGPGAWFARDLRLLLARRGEILRRRPELATENGVGLLWLEPWPEGAQFTLNRLDPFFVEICRRVRLIENSTGIVAVESGSAKARIDAKALNGVTGDPWAPVERSAGKCFSITGAGFDYRTVLRLLSADYQAPVLLDLAPGDAEKGLSLFACAVARGQGKTEGYHERRIPISKYVGRLIAARATDEIAQAGRRRSEEAGRLAGSVLRPALFCLLREGRTGEQLSPKVRENLRRTTDRYTDRLDREVDADFFPRLWEELDTGDPAEREQRHTAWLRAKVKVAEGLLGEAIGSLPLASIHRYRARSRARGLFHGLKRKHFPQLDEDEADDAAAA